MRFLTEGILQHFEQQAVIEWFREEFDSTFSHGFGPYLGIVKCRNKNYGDVAILLFQPGLQLETRHLRHADVNYQARGPVTQIGFEECFC
jgi:hypothetical protein